MTTVSGTLTAVGSSASLRIRPSDQLVIAITGSFTADWAVEKEIGGNWQAAAAITTGSDAGESAIYDLGDYDGRVRVRCTSFDSGTIAYSINDTDAVGQPVVGPSGVTVAQARDEGFDLLLPMVNGVAVSTTAAELNVLDAAPVAFTVALAASATTDGMDITITAVDAGGDTVAGVFLFEMWISEAATGIGLTADTYSGDVTWGTGTEWEEIVTKKHYRVLTATTGIAVATAVASANPADQYVAVANPFNAGKVIVSAVSGTNWEGA